MKKRTSTSRLRRIKIQYRLLAVFFFISLVPTICLGLYAYRVYTNSINDKVGDSALQTVLSLNKNMLTELEKFQDYCSALSVTDVIQDGLAQTPTENFSPSRELVTAINDISKQIPFQSIYLKNLRIVDRADNIIYDLGYDDIPKQRLSELLREVDGASPRDSLQYIHTYRSTDKVVLGRKLYNMNFTGQTVGYIMVYIDEHLFSDQIFSDVSFGENSNIMLVNGKGDVLSSQDRTLLGTRFHDDALTAWLQQNVPDGAHMTNMAVNGVEQLVIAAYNRQLDNYLIAMIPKSYIANETNSINSTLILLAVFLIFLSLVFTLVVYVSIVSPIRNMISACNVTSDKDINIHINDKNPDELGFLARTIDHMVDELQFLMDRLKQDQTRKRQLELQMLQYQINPHFLFNTLNSLQWVATINEVPILTEGISSLSALLRSTLIKTDELIPLCEEIENLRHYFSIQNIRYGNSFDVNYQLAPETLARMLPRFVLQPLAENAIIHGSENLQGPVLITISSVLDEDGGMIIDVRDNGCGFDTSTLDYLQKERFSGIGLNNVNERLKLQYGAKHGLAIISQPGKGTVCRLSIPLSENERGG